MTFRGSTTLALMCREPLCEEEAELLVCNDEFPDTPYSEWCLKHYQERVSKNPRAHSTDLVYKLVRVPNPRR